MPTYTWQALDGSGRTKKGFREADSPRSLRQLLRDEGLTPTKVDETESAKDKSTGKPVKSSIRKLPTADLVAITKQFATLLKSGLPIDTSLQAMIDQTNKTQQKNLLTSIKNKISEGFTFAQALASFPHIFPNFYIATVKAGEKTSTIPMVLGRLADYLHTSYTTRQKITQALIYPAMITMVAISVIVALLTFVVPSIVEVFESAEQSLPALTQALIAISDFLRDWGLYILATVLIALLLFKLMLKRESVRHIYHRFLLKLPIYGKLLREQNTSRFNRTLGILLESNVDFYEAMRIATAIVDMLPIRNALEQATQRVQEGSSVYVALNRTGYFSPISLNLIASGEKSGTLPEMLYQSAENQDQDTMNAITLFVSVFEPVIIVLMGGIVLIIVMAILTPIFNMNNLV